MRAIRFLCAGAILVVAAQAQEFRGTILGRITDTSGAVLVNASITVTNESTNTAVKTTTTAAGSVAYGRIYIRILKNHKHICLI